MKGITKRVILEHLRFLVVVPVIILIPTGVTMGLFGLAWLLDYSSWLLNITGEVAPTNITGKQILWTFNGAFVASGISLILYFWLNKRLQTKEERKE